MEVSIRKLHRLFVFLGILLVIVEGKAPVGEWTVSDTNGNPCMKMQMAATITIPYVTNSGENTNAIVDVPTTADPSHYSKCDGPSVSFKLKFFSNGWSLWFDYKKSGSKYKLDTIGVGYTYDNVHFPGAAGGGFSSSSISDSDLPTTHVGNYYGCNKTSFDIFGITLDMSDVKFQPYVQDVPDKGYGKMEVCSTGGGISGEAVMILIIIAVALVIIVPIVVTVVCVVRRKRRNQQFDYQPQ
ncbi:uncharacterized protein LOC117121199 [Anneissia japonica]|uniref:uncharacterized protein LOC117121199 n=1 Tax=Anneissia japonica TaxID=1529436 RepID=UPI001425A3E0|nr:uncharacterized protein LOC117121199 [Anneissia japonica]